MAMDVAAVLSGQIDQTVQVGPLDATLPQADRLTLSSPTLRSLADYEPGSPGWWMARLLTRLDARGAEMQLWDDYYRGRQPLAFASAKFRDAFGGRFRAFSSNFCSLVVDATRERLEVQGFAMRNSRSATRAWRLWQESSMDAQSAMAHTEVMVKGLAYVLVEPRAGSLRITVEDPLGAITESDPREPGRRLAGLKRWIDERGDVVVLYMPDTVWKFRIREGAIAPLEVRDEPWPLPNPLGAVPLVPLAHRPRLDGTTQGEIEPVKSNQDAINKYRADALVAAEFGAFRQRWAIGLEIPVDPVTHQAIEPFKAAVDRVWYMPPRDPDDPDRENRQFGEFEQTDLAPYQAMIESEIGAMSSISRVPYHYLLGQPQAVPPSGESLKSSEAGLIRKVGTAAVYLGEGWEEVARLALRAVNDAGANDLSLETIWKDPETRNEAVTTDAVIKQFQAGLLGPQESYATRAFAMSQLGYSPQQITSVLGIAPSPSDAAATAGIRPDPDAESPPSTPGLSPTVVERPR